MEKISSSAALGLLARRFILRHWLGSPWQTLLQLLILALGIAVFFSIRLANRAAVDSFQNFTSILSQESDFQITAPAGELPVSALESIRQALGDWSVNIIPVVETTATQPRTQKEEHIGSRRMFHLLGLDLVSIQNVAFQKEHDSGWFDQTNAATHQQSGRTIWSILQETNAVFISHKMADKEVLKLDELFPVVIDDAVVQLKIAGFIPDSPSRPAALESLLIMDLPTLQKLAHKVGRLDRIEFTVPDGDALETRRAMLHQKLVETGKDRWQVSTPADRRSSAAVMTRAFRMNLNILSLISLLVGLYLIFQSLDGAVIRRREEISVLRSLGFTEQNILQSWLLEAALLGLLGGILGALLGWAGAQVAVQFVGRTVNALYFATTVQSANLDGFELLLAILLAICASLLAGWWPARQAAKTPPAQILSRHLENPARKTLWQSTQFAALIAGVSGGLAFLPPLRFSGGLRLPLAGYAAAFGLILAGGMLAGHALATLAKWSKFLGRRSVAAKLATSHVAHPSSRHRLAVSGLLAAVTMASGMLILVSSFEATMRGWIGNSFQADFYLSSAGAESASTQNRIPPATWQAISRHPQVAEINVLQTSEISINGLSTMLVGVDADFSKRHQNLMWRQAPLDDQFFSHPGNESLALVSESFGDRFRVGRGDSVTIPTPEGEKQLRIAGVFSDYGNERGSLVVDRRQFGAWFGHNLATSLIVMTTPTTDPDALQSELSLQYPGLSILTNRYLRTEILRIFRQTFSITYALELIAIIVAVIGLGMTLSSILIDRRSELTTLRALGWKRRELAVSTAIEGSLISVCGVAVGLVVSIGLGWILIYVINKQSFGWTLQLRLPWDLMSALAALVVASGTLVAYYVGKRGSNLKADHEE